MSWDTEFAPDDDGRDDDVALEPYSDEVRRLFAGPRHAGVVDDGIECARSEQGVRVRLTMIQTRGRIGTLRFQAWGCPHFLAACESACASLESRPLEALQAFEVSGLMQNLAVPVEKTGRILVLEDALRSLGTSARAFSDDTQD